MPPQQPHRLLDFFDQIDCFRAHDRPFDVVDVTASRGFRNPGAD
jgi:hypothetical protein